MTGAAAWARFDDLRSGSALACPPPLRILATRRFEDVLPVLSEVEQATAAGNWAFGYVSYAAAHGVDPTLPVATPSDDDPPLVWFGICRAPTRVPPVRPVPGRPQRGLGEWVPDWTAEIHRRKVAAVREQIAAGETYQCNLTDRLRSEAPGHPEDLYRNLALAQRSAYNAYIDTGRYAVVSASPELFFEWSGDRLRTRPMKGTAARGRTPGEDRQRAQRLLHSPKERAENVMIVDLIRNDLSRVARTGTVDVSELLTLEAYPTVWQLTSEVRARTVPDAGLPDIFTALFPCGSVTGAPKRRTMQLIRDLEGSSRGIYCGAIGLVAPPTAAFRARFSVAIRTAVVDRHTGMGVYGAGGGITWDSDPAAEWAELLTKAAIL